MFYQVYETHDLLEGKISTTSLINKNFKFWVGMHDLKLYRYSHGSLFDDIKNVELISIYEIKYLKGDEYVKRNC